MSDRNDKDANDKQSHGGRSSRLGADLPLSSRLGYSGDAPTSPLSPLRRAILSMEKMEAKLTILERARSEPIAVVGVGCRFPGGVGSPEAFWRLLEDRVDAVVEIPASRWGARPLEKIPADPAQRELRFAALLEEIDRFDARFFGISPREAISLDPQQRLVLEVAWEALEHAGLLPEQLKGTRAGVFLGITMDDYREQCFTTPPETHDVYTFTGNMRCFPAGRLSYVLGLEGPSLVVDTACSSSLVSVHLACQSLRNGECSVALAGGVSAILSSTTMHLLSLTQALSPDGRCKAFDAQANGFVRGEGCGIIVLKRLSDALSDGNDIWALIRGSAINQDGHSTGLTAPNGLSQQAMLRQALENARVSPSSISFIEAHGTGTALGDPIEFEALASVFGEPRSDGSTCALGAVKTNIGHLESAAGIAGLIKVVMALRKEAIPPNLHFKKLNPHISLEGTPFVIPTERIAWPAGSKPRLAGVSSFGLSGTNAHVILEEPPNLDTPARGASSIAGPHLLTLSARSHEALLVLARAHCKGPLAGATTLGDICYSASVHRSHHEHRLTAVASSTDEMRSGLEAILRGEEAAGVLQGRRAPGAPLKRVFVFPGQGSQWLGMGRQLLEQEPVFRRAIEACELEIHRETGWSLLDELRADADHSRLSQIDVVQPTLFAIEVALAALWRSWGVEPDAVVGHSMGEVAAAYVAGALSLEDAARIICRRSQLLRRVSGQGAMALVELSIEQTQEALRGHEEQLSVAVSNSPRSTVISGDPIALEQVLVQLASQHVFCRLVKVDVASHSPQMDPLRAELLAALAEVTPREAKVPMYSTVTGGINAGPELTAEYWVQNLRMPVLFSRVVQQLIEADHDLFLEMSPHPILLPAIEEGLTHARREGTVVPSLRRDQEERRGLLEALGTLYCRGQDVEWKRLYRSGERFVPLPTYPWQRERYWVESADPRTSSLGRRPRGRGDAAGHPLLGASFSSSVNAGTHFWEQALSTEALPYLADHCVQGVAVMPAAAYVEMALAAAAELHGADIDTLEQVTFERMLALPTSGHTILQVTLLEEQPGQTTFQVSSREQTADATSLSAWQRHAVGRLRRTEDKAADPGTPVGSPQQIRQRCTTTLTGAEHYQRAADRGLSYGPSFQGLRQLWLGADEALGQVRLPEGVASTGADYQLHPALLDACFQVVLGLFCSRDQDAAEHDTLVPVSLERARRHRPLGPEVWVHARRRPADGATDSATESLVADLLLLDAQGQVLAEALGLRAQRLAPEAIARPRGDDWLYALRWLHLDSAPPPVPAAAAAAAGAWLLLLDHGQVGSALHSLWLARGEPCLRVVVGERYERLEPDLYRLDPSDPHAFHALLRDAFTDQRPCRGVVHLWSLDTTATAHTTVTTLASDLALGPLSVVHLVQALGQQAWRNVPRLWLVTRGAQRVGADTPLAPAQAPLWGLGRSLAIEHPQMQCSLLDLSPTPHDDEALALLRELAPSNAEDQIALRPDARYVARLVRTSFEAAEDRESGPERAPAGDRSYRLEIQKPGVLERMALREAPRRRPSPGEVEIEVEAAGLNFIDIMKVLGIYPGLPGGSITLGGECAGRIIAVGKAVDELEVGQEVVALAQHSLASHVMVDARFVVLRPASLSAEAASALSLVFMTAWYALYDLAGLRQGERILIHSATGGTGLSAIQLAQRVGAEIFATAGTPEKREFLRDLGIRHVMDSRSLSFADEVMDRTRGEGVDVVLNSLSGEAIPKSLSTLAHDGRFIELGKRDIYANYAIGLSHFRKSLSYSAVDLAGLFERKPALISSLLRTVMSELEAGRLKPLPCRVFPVAEVEEAFRLMAQARHVGKIVVAMRDPEVRIAPPAGEERDFQAEATYLITGGLGGLGLSVAQWMVERGARHLALVGRSAPSASAEQAIQRMQAGGCQVMVARADVAQRAEVVGVLAEIEQRLPPLRGVLHAAAVLEDSTLMQMNAQQLRKVMGPKVLGAWNLHELTRGEPLDFFVLYSSAASLLGSPGQGNYAAANAFLDALAQHRRQLGLPGLSINWGAFSEVGLAAAQANRGERLSFRGLGSITPEQGQQVLGRLLRGDLAQIGVLQLDARQWVEFYPTAAASPVWSELLQESRAKGDGGQRTALRDTLLKAASEQRLGLLEKLIGEQVARVLRMDASSLERQRPFRTMGLDSLMNLELRNRLESSLGVKLSATLTFAYPDLAALTDHVFGKLELPTDTSGAPPTQPASEAPSPISDDIQQLEKDDLLAFFDDTLNRIEKERAQ